MEYKKDNNNLILSNARFQKEKNYWLTKLSGEIKFGAFPVDKKLEVNSYDYRTISYTLDSDISKRIISMANKSELGIYMILVSGVYYLLQKYTGDEDIILGMPVLRHLLGNEYINNLVALRIKADSNEKFRDLMLSIKDTISEAIKNQNYPLEKILEFTNYRIDDKRSALMNIIVLLDSIHHREIIQDVKSDIVFSFSLSDDNILLDLEYNSEIFESEKIQEIIDRIILYFNQITINPDLKLCEIDILLSKEKNNLLFEFNDTKCNFQKEMTIQQLIEVQAQQLPNKIAIVCKDSNVTYKEFNEKANQLARLLREQGVKANDIVGIMAKRSVNLMVGLLAILKAGGAYIPIDPSYPENRINYMLEDSGARIILTQKELAPCIRGKSEIIFLDDENIYPTEVTNIERVNTSEDMAYVLYTSGTTGKPKGIMIEHHNIINLISGVAEKIEFSRDSAILCLTTSCFDIFVLETWVSFSKGLKVVLLEETDQYNLKKLSDIIVKNNVDMLQMTPSRMKMFLEDRNTIDCLAKIKTIILGGENFQAKLLRKIKNHTKARIYNGYGPTETTVYSIMKDLTETEKVTIGKPIANTRIYIIDKHRNLQPIGVPGELCIAGEGLARGYLNKYELTDEKFVSNPFETGKKMYCTGDLARWLPNGDIEYMDRIDFQVKIRGFRIELGEIESKLINHPVVNEAAIIDLTNSDNSKYLCAYIVCSEEISILDLREYLKKELPDYMIPTYFIKLDKLPINLNGKLERRLLPLPNNNMETGVDYVPPKNNIEEKLVQIWQEILGVNRVGINDNFFALGGNSLKVIQTVSKLMLQFDVNTNDIFRYQTIAELSEKISLKTDNLKSTIEQLKELIKHTNEFNIEMDELRNCKLEEYYKKNKKYINLDLSERVTYNNVFLTGVTGYLGIHLLFELMISTKADVYLPVREKENSSVEARLLKKISFYFGNEFYEKYKSRIYILECNIVNKNFGLPNNIYEQLSDKIDCIINGAANVKHYGQKSEFEDININLINSLVEFASVGKRKDINHISSLGVGKGDVEKEKDVLFTEYDTEIRATIDNHYIKSKLLAEKLVIEARKKGINTNIFRCGNLSYNTNTFRFQENISNNAFLTFIKSFIEIGHMPNINRKLFDISFIDYVSKAVILLFNRVDLMNEVFHVCNPNDISLRELGELIQNIGFSIKFDDVDKFMDFLNINYESEDYKEHITNILLNIHLLKIFHNKNLEIVSDKTTKLLERLGFEWPQVNEGHIKDLLNYCIDVNFISKN